jgi:hypothetical protein
MDAGAALIGVLMITGTQMNPVPPSRLKAQDSRLKQAFLSPES